MKKLLILLLLPLASTAQVTKNVIVEHFTNTYCSICASRNPGFYTNLVQFPQVIHISYYPSSPYPACPINQHNKAENDARTNYYGVYGSTPRLAIQGTVIPAQSSYSDPVLFNTQTGQTTPFEVKITMYGGQNNTATIACVVKRVSAGNVTGLNLYGAVVEDTLAFAANNGETKLYNVFRKSVWSAQPMSLTVPANVGDSTISIQNISLNTQWNINKLYTIAVLQDDNKAVVQAAKSNHLSAKLNTPNLDNTPSITLFPNPANNRLYIQGNISSNTQAVVYNVLGLKLKDEHLQNNSIDINNLQPGVYHLYLSDGVQGAHYPFIKQ